MMRRSEREIKSRETIDALLERTLVGRIATINRKRFPVIKPVNFLYWDGKIYFHSSKQGEKMADIRRGSRICFEVDEPIAYVLAKGSACSSSYLYRSIIVKGKGHLVNQREKKLTILKRLMEKYQPEGGYDDFPQAMVQKTAVVEISIQEMTAKQNLGS
jgi:nitroimidazol reductase NimA-like FMN-containing flavoprotein (pyridoxamine 5'-phosphate oxidase superfamily)